MAEKQKLHYVMKRLLLAIAIAFLLVTVYMIGSSVIFILSGQNLAIVPYLDLPVRLPKIIIYYFSPPTAEDFSTKFTTRRWVFALLVFGTNALLYSIPAYILLTIFSRTRKKIVSARELEPPPPPTFIN